MAERFEIRFSRSLYDPPAIHAALAAWAGLADFDVAEHEAELVVSVLTDDADLPDAFANHALFEAIRRARATPEATG